MFMMRNVRTIKLKHVTLINYFTFGIIFIFALSSTHPLPIFDTMNIPNFNNLVVHRIMCNDV